MVKFSSQGLLENIGTNISCVLQLCSIVFSGAGNVISHTSHTFSVIHLHGIIFMPIQEFIFARQ